MKGTKKAAEQPQEEPKPEEQQSEGQQAPTGDPGIDFNQVVWENGLGQYEYTGEVFQGTDGAWYWPVYTRGADGRLYVSYLDTAGNYLWTDEEPLDNGPNDQNANTGEPVLTEADIEALAWEYGLGEYVSSEFQPSDGETVDAWRVITHDVNGDEVVVFINDKDRSYTIY